MQKVQQVFKVQLVSGKVFFFKDAKNARRFARNNRDAIRLTGTCPTSLVGDSMKFYDNLVSGV